MNIFRKINENWVTINHGEIINPEWPVANGIYEISSLGRIRRKKTGNIYSRYFISKNNAKVYLCSEWNGNIDMNNKCSYQVSHIMAVEFLGYKNVYGKHIDLTKIVDEINK